MLLSDRIRTILYCDAFATSPKLQKYDLFIHQNTPYWNEYGPNVIYRFSCEHQLKNSLAVFLTWK